MARDGHVKPGDLKGIATDLSMNKDFSQAHPFLKSFQSHLFNPPDVSVPTNWN